MIKFLNKLLAILCMASLLSACDTSISDSVDNFKPSAGDADFSTFVTVGDSLTAGYRDSALFRDGQIDSFGAILAQQFRQVGGGSFEQPLRLPEATGSFVGIPTTAVMDRVVLVATGDPDRPVLPNTIDPTVPTNVVPMPGMAFNNFGIPSAKLPNLDDPGFGNPMSMTANPFYVRMATLPGTSTLIGDAAMRMPTFFTFWIGNNDILLNAVVGSPGTDNPTIGTGLTEVTDPMDFDTDYSARVADIKTATNKGVLMNIPDVRTIPFFTTVPYNAIPLDAATATQLNTDVAAVYDLVLNSAVFNGLDPAEAALRRISYSEGQNPILISDDTLTDISSEFVGPLAALIALAQARQATPDDLILLTASSKLGEEDTPGNPLSVWGVTLPLEDGDALIKDEADAIEAIRQSYNATITAEADADADLLLFDSAALLTELNETGLLYGSGGVSSAFIQGGFFSLDGIHPTPRGNAVIVNELIKVINEGFNARVAPVDPNEFGTVDYQK